MDCKTLLTPALSLSALSVSSCLAMASVAAMMFAVGISLGPKQVLAFPTLSVVLRFFFYQLVLL